MKRWSSISRLIIGLLALTTVACDRGSTPPASSPAATNGDGPKNNVPMGQLLSSAKKQQIMKEMAADFPSSPTSLPAGHPPIGNMPGAQTGNLPPGHPPMGSMPAADAGSLPPGHPTLPGAEAMPVEPQRPEHMLQLKPPPTWQSKPARSLTVAIYALPKAAGDDSDAELTISHYPEMKKIPAQMHIDRWAGMFEPSTSQPATANIRQSKLENAPHPTTIADISGRYRAGAMGMGATTAKDNQRMMAAIVETQDGPWFFKLVGPQATVARHADEFLDFIRQAK